MKQHNESVHEKNEPFQCDICETSFLQEYSLKQHKESIHEKVKPITEDLPYSCMKCPKKFGDTKSAQTHFLKDHLHRCVKSTVKKRRQHLLGRMADFPSPVTFSVFDL